MSQAPSGSCSWGWQGSTTGIAERIKYVLATGECSDVHFTVGRQLGEAKLFKAHKFVLTISSEVFDTMLNGSLPENSGVIDIPDIPPQGFGNMISYLYTDAVEDLNFDNVFPTLYCAKKYGIPSLTELCSGFITSNLNKGNCLDILENAKLLDVENVVNKCLQIVDAHGGEVLQSERFAKTDSEVLQMILKRDTLPVKEYAVYLAVDKWAKNTCWQHNLEPTAVNCRQMLGPALFLVRFPLMKDNEIADGPGTSGLLSKEELFQIHQYKHATIKPEIPFPTNRRSLAMVDIPKGANVVLDNNDVDRSPRIYLGDMEYILSRNNPFDLHMASMLSTARESRDRNRRPGQDVPECRPQ